MINLIPPNIRENTMYARRNALLRRWAMGLLVGIAGIGLVVGSGFIYMNKLGKDYSAQAQLAQTELDKQNPAATQKQVEDISNSLKLVIQVLSKEILFSKLLKQIGASLPSGSILQNLSINKVQGGIDLQFGATDYHTASQVQVNLQDPKNKIFNKADIVSITCGLQTEGYPCGTNIRAQFTTNNPFLFINSTGATSK